MAYSIERNSFSPMIVTPSFFASSSLLPASSPISRKSVFLLTAELTLPPRSLIISFCLFARERGKRSREHKRLSLEDLLHTALFGEQRHHPAVAQFMEQCAVIFIPNPFLERFRHHGPDAVDDGNLFHGTLLQCRRYIFHRHAADFYGVRSGSKERCLCRRVAFFHGQFPFGPGKIARNEFGRFSTDVAHPQSEEETIQRDLACAFDGGEQLLRFLLLESGSPIRSSATRKKMSPGSEIRSAASNSSTVSFPRPSMLSA